MDYRVKVKQVEAALIASVRGESTLGALSKDLPRLLDEVWAFLRGTDLWKDGHNVVIYHNGPAEVEVGVQVARPFEDTPRISCSSSPAGTVAAVTHRGPYHLLPKAHEAIGAWCGKHGYETTGPAWEVYGDWTEDAAKLETEVLCIVTRR